MGDSGLFSGVGQSLAGALGTPALRRLQLAWTASSVGGWVFFVALAVYAYDAGGATAVGAAALVRMVPAGLAAPLAGLLADRHSRRDVLFASLVARAAVLGLIVAAIAAGAPLGIVLGLAAVFTIVTTAHKPAQASLLPSLADTPQQLAACNAVSSAIDNAAFLFGALLGGVLIATTSVETSLAATTALFAAAALPIALIPRDEVPPYRAAGEEASPFRGWALGFREITANRGLRLLVGFLSISTFIEGAVDVLVVVVAIELLDLGGAGVGWLNAAWGLGGLIGGAAALALLGRGRLATGLAFGGLLVGVPLMLIAAAVEPAVGASMLVLLGVGYALIEIAGLSLLQRLTSDDVLGRAFAVVESSYWITTGLGAMLAPAIIALLGARGALVAVGACLPLVVALRWQALAQFEAGAAVPERPFRALRSLPLFQPLAIATVENVSRNLAEVQVPAGEVVIREGEPGDRFYIVVEGALDVTCESGSYPPMAGGDFFGEIALLRECPRTATVTARSDAVLYALERESFLCAVGGHRCAGQVARREADIRLARSPVA